MRNWKTITALLAAVALAYVAFAPVASTQPTGWLSLVQQNPQGVVQFRAMSAYGQPALIGVGTAAPTAANSSGVPATNGELFLIRDNAAANEPVMTFYSGASTAWRSLPISTYATNAPNILNSVWFGANTITFEGATADAFETILQAEDADTGVHTYQLSDNNAAADTYVLIFSMLDTNALNVANSVWFDASSLVFEGATGADTFQIDIAAEDPVAADRTWTLADYDADAALVGSLVATNAPDTADSVWFAANSLIFEGATGGNAFEIILAADDSTVGIDSYQLMDHALAADTYNIVANADGEVIASQYFLPTQAGLPVDAGAAVELPLAGDNTVVCYRAYYPYVTTVTEVVLYEYQVAAAGADDYLGFAIYYDADAGAQITEGASVYAADGAALVVDLPDVTLFPGWYRFCAAQNDISAQDWLAVAQTAVVTAVYNETVSEIRYGVATNVSAGNADMPATTGALATTAEGMFVAHIQSN